MKKSVPRVNKSFANTSLGQQLAAVAAGLCLLVSLALVALAAVSSRHVQAELQQSYGDALARLIAHRISSAMESGDLLSVSAELRRFVEISSAQEVVLIDVEGKEIGQAGGAGGETRHRYRAPVRIESDIAGQVSIYVNTDAAAAAQRRLLLGLLGLAILLSLAIYAGVRHAGQRLGNRLAQLARSISLEQEEPREQPENEVALLARRVEALPMDLLRTRAQPGPRDENYRCTAVLYLHLGSLVDYVDRLDELALQRYINRLHQLVYAAAGFYAGELQVARQFGLAVYFTGPSQAGSAAFRAASCAWLVRAVSRELEQQMSLSMNIAMAISQSELGAGDGSDIYPGLYTQHALDDLQAVCAHDPAEILLSPAAREDLDVASRLRLAPREADDYSAITEFAGTYRDLLERQLRLILKQLEDPTTGM